MMWWWLREKWQNFHQRVVALTRSSPVWWQRDRGAHFSSRGRNAHLRGLPELLWLWFLTLGIKNFVQVILNGSAVFHRYKVLHSVTRWHMSLILELSCAGFLRTFWSTSILASRLTDLCPGCAESNEKTQWAHCAVLGSWGSWTSSSFSQNPPASVVMSRFLRARSDSFFITAWCSSTWLCCSLLSIHSRMDICFCMGHSFNAEVIGGYLQLWLSLDVG